MHSTMIQHEGKHYDLLHNGDYSGDVEIMHGKHAMTVPFAVLAELVGRALMSEKISELEDKTGLEYLGFEDSDA